MRAMPMPGGWTMSMVWMRMPGQTWPEAAVTFIGMWVVMMVAMMLPSLAPILWRYRRAVRSTGETRKAWLTTLVPSGSEPIALSDKKLSIQNGCILSSTGRQ
jgi:predicted metal-binding membrane protein